jgi:hypothetical protein
MNIFRLFLNSNAKETKKAEIGKKYYDSLNTGDEFKYVTSDGTVVTARKSNYLSHNGLNAACEVIDGIEIKKSTKRFPKFSQLVIPTVA